MITYERYKILRHNTISELYYIWDVYFKRVLADGLTKQQAKNWSPN